MLYSIFPSVAEAGSGILAHVLATEIRQLVEIEQERVVVEVMVLATKSHVLHFGKVG